MNASTQRAVARWLHIVASIPILGYIYGPVADMPGPAMFVKVVVIPTVAFSGLWLWKGHLVRRLFVAGKPGQPVTRS